MYGEIAANKRKTALLMFVFVALVAGLAWLVGQYLGRPLLTPYFLAGALVYAIISYFAGSSAALALNGAQEITKNDNPRLWRIVENLAITDGLPMPRVFIMNDPAPNAFATGRDPSHAAVCATTGILEIMTDTELQGVFAHEMGHVKNYDIRVSMIAFALVGVVGVISDILLQLTWFRGSSNDEEGDNSNSSSPLVMVAGLAAMVLAPLAATMIQLAISRRREYLADATGSLTTRHPEGLASALEKIATVGSATSRQVPSTAHLFFANPLRAGSISGLFSTHPPIEDRIRRLRSMNTHA